MSRGIDPMVRQFVVNLARMDLTEDEVFDAVISRFGMPVDCHSQKEVAKRQGISLKRVQRIEERALSKMAKKLKGLVI